MIPLVTLLVALMLTAERDGFAADVGSGWKTDFDSVLEEAGSSGKGIATVFRGPNSSPPCRVMNETVLDSEPFINALSEDFILLSVADLRDSPKKPDGQVQHKALMERFKVTAYPVLFLADSKARVYAQMPLQQGTLEACLEKVASLKPKRQALDVLLAAAELPAGKALRILRMADALEQLGEDTSLTYYSEYVEELIDSDPDGTLGYSSVWKRRKGSEKALADFGRIYAEMAPVLWSLQTSTEMVALIDTTIAEKELQGELRQLMEMQKFRAWGKERNYSKMLEVAEGARALVPDSGLAKRIPVLITRIKELQLQAENEPVDADQEARALKELEEMQKNAAPEGSLGAEARQIAQFSSVYSSLKPALAKLNSTGEKIALLESTMKQLELVGGSKQMMQMEVFKLWKVEENLEMMLKSGEAAIETDPTSALAQRLKRMIAPLKKPAPSENGSKQTQ